MRRFVEGVDRGQTTLFPECLEDWIGEDNPVRVVDVFVEELDLAELSWGVFMLMIGSTSNYLLMLFYRVLLGLAEGPQSALVNKVVKRWFPKHER
jgi:MFS family permease